MNTTISTLFICFTVCQGEPATCFVQVQPAPTTTHTVVRSAGQQQAIVLLHGLRLSWQNAELVRAPLLEWQNAGSMTVQLLARQGDVFAFTFSQTASVERIANSATLKDGIRQLRQVGYRQIVLVAYSAGGLVARQLVQDHPHLGVTHVVQVCSPNGGCHLANLNGAVVLNQQDLVASLTPEARRLSLLRRQHKTIPTEIHFVCVVGARRLVGDGVVSWQQQWSADLQEQGIPAVAVAVDHGKAMTDLNTVKTIAQLIQQPRPRLSTSAVIWLRHHLQR